MTETVWRGIQIVTGYRKRSGLQRIVKVDERTVKVNL